MVFVMVQHFAPMLCILQKVFAAAKVYIFFDINKIFLKK